MKPRRSTLLAVLSATFAATGALACPDCGQFDLDPPDFGKLVYTLLPPDPYHRARTLQLAGDSGDRSWIPIARELLRGNEAPVVQARAIELLGRLRDKASLTEIAAKLASPYTSVRAIAAWALGEFSDPVAEAAILPLVRLDQDVPVLHAAVQALSKSGSVRSERTVMVALRHSDARIRESAARTLGAIGDEAAVGALFAQLDRETDLGVQKALVQAVGRIGGPFAGEQLAHLLAQSSSPLRQRMAAEAFIEMGSSGAPTLADLIETSEDPKVQRLAKATLSHIEEGR